MPVRILEERVINQIAAGEVVERPASVVKELVENALDAGASELRVHLRAGGRNLVRVVDNGAGMNRVDALTAIERHATSKVRDERDLFAIHTLGFRGEALPSIASVSKFQLLTRPADEEVGTRIRIDGGKLQEVEPAGCAPGTEVEVASLFFNIPARRKFLRSVDTELGHCVEAVTREALIRPHLDVEVSHDDREVVRAAPTNSRARRAADLLGPHGEALVPAAFTRGTLEVEALLSPVGVHRSSPAGCTWLYVNGRFVRDPVLRRAVTAAYAGIVPKDRYPVVVVEVRLPAAEVDVNVHPAKTEVRFAHAWELQGAVTEGLRAALQEHGIRRPVATEARYRAPEPEAPRQVELLGPSPPRPTPSAPPAPRFVPPPVPPVPEPPRFRPVPVVAEPPAPGWSPPAAPVAPEPPLPARSDALLPVARFRDLRVLGQLANTYLLCEGAGELVIIDQHAAHERVTLHRLRQDALARVGPAQRLLAPVLIDLSVARARALAAEVDRLADVGLEVSAMGGRTFAVHAVPPALAGADLQALLADVADEVLEEGTTLSSTARFEQMLATMACHTSVRAGQRLDHGEMVALLRALDEVDFSVCAHGRPVAIRIGAGELERRFHRA